ncbi:hypothetical protein GCM10017687_26640 [Streptomyces echinatus]
MHTPSRRTLLRAPLAAAGVGLLPVHPDFAPRPHQGPEENRLSEAGFAAPAAGQYVDPSGPEVLAAERRRGLGPMRRFRFTAAETRLDLGGQVVRSWAYNETLPGPVVRVTAGDVLNLTLANHLPVTTTLHAHGVQLRCDMDGVPDVTQKAIRPGADFTYRFTVSHPGTYLLHSHVGLQPDRALYAPLIVEDPKEPLSYDKEWVILLDDWLDGVNGSTPDQVLDQLQPGTGTSMMHGGMARDLGRSPAGPSRVLHNSYSRALNSEGGNVAYPYYLANGRPPSNPQSLRCRPRRPRPAALHQRRLRHRLPGGTGRSHHDRHAHRRLSRGAHADRRSPHRHGRAIRRPGHRQGRRLPPRRTRRGQEGPSPRRAAHRQRKKSSRTKRPPGRTGPTGSPRKSPRTG